VTDYSIKDFLPAIAIIGPILAATITALVTRHFRERKRVDFLISNTEDLTPALRRSQRKVQIRIDDHDVETLNRAFIEVECKGNTTIRDFRCDFIVPGLRSICLHVVLSPSEYLQKAISADWRDEAFNGSPAKILQIKTDFLNPKERLRVNVFFDGEGVQCDAGFRMEGIHYTLKRRFFTAFGPEVLQVLHGMWDAWPTPIRQIMQFPMRLPKDRKRQIGK
jgi:hypothetical protein